MGQVAAEASPAAVMDLSFANQTLCTRYLLQAHQQLAPAVYDVPSEIDERVAQLKVQACGVQLDSLTDEQFAYQHQWSYGTV